jgi:hypothetical protein
LGDEINDWRLASAELDNPLPAGEYRMTLERRAKNGGSINFFFIAEKETVDLAKTHLVQ